MKKFLLLLIVFGVAGWFGVKYFKKKETPPVTNTPAVSTVPTKTTEPAATANKDPSPPQVPQARETPLLMDESEANDAIHLFKSGRFQEALNLFQKDLVDPQYMRVQARNLAYIAKSHEYLGDMGKAKENWELLLGKFPQSNYTGDAKYFLARQARQDGRESSGFKLLEESAAQFGKSVGGNQAVLDLAQHYFGKGEELAAWQWYSQAMRGDFPRELMKNIQGILNTLLGKMLAAPKKIPGCVYYRVEPRDVLIKVARKFKTSTGIIRWVNKRSSDMLRIGEELAILPGPIWLDVNKKAFMLSVFLENGLYLRGYDVGLGKDDKTPLGTFTIQTQLKNPDWYHEGRRIPFGDPRNLLGTRWMGFENKVGVSGFGIHGTSEPDTIGKSLSNGCVRMRNPEVEELYELVPKQTKVVIR